jgi:Uma2 family endonuclease
MHTIAGAARRIFTFDDMRRMQEVGMLPHTGFELRGGELVEKSGRATPRRWSYDEYVQLGEAGILRPNERTELLNGEIVTMTPVGHRHIFVVDLLTEMLGSWAHGRAVLRVQSPLRFTDIESPYPDIVLLRMHEDRYRSREAGPWDAPLIVEVADTSIAYDREKAFTYARAAVPEYWIVDVDRSTVIVHLDPVGGEYTQVSEYARGERWTSPAMEGREISTEQVVG